MPGLKAAQGRLTLLLRTNDAGDCKWKPMFTCHSQNPRALKNNTKLACLVYNTSNNKAWMIADLFTKWFTEYFKPTVLSLLLSKKEIPFNILLTGDNTLGLPRALMEIPEESNVVIPVTTSILQLTDHRVLTDALKSYYLCRHLLRLQLL